MEDSLKLLVVVHHFPPDHISGAEWQAYRIARGLRQRGDEAHVICVQSDARGPAGQLGYTDGLYDGIPVRRLYFNLPLAPDPFRWSFRNPLVERQILSYLEDFQPNVLHLISGYLMSGTVISASRSLGVPVVLMPMDFWFLCPRVTLLRRDGSVCDAPEDLVECALCLAQDRRRYRLTARLTGGASNRLLRRLWRSPAVLRGMGKADLLAALEERRRYLRGMFRAPDLVISNSRFLREMLTTHGLHNPRFRQLRQGIDTERWVGDSEKEPSPYLRVGYIGQIARHKGVDLLVRAFRRLRAQGPPPRLLLYGNAEQFPAFTRRLHRLIDGDRRITFAGTFPNERILEIHSGLDVLVVPSVWYENSPNVILEAFAAGTPVIASDRGGLAELVQHGVNGLLFRMGDAGDLAVQLQRVVDQPALLESLRKGIRPVKTVQEEIAEWLQIYHSVTQGVEHGWSAVN
ncbi:MAG TPA: glycosyltransferase [Anaerolineae bacterium]|nr:glycosyltransferase [Anaerolineae bacterium]